MSTEITTATKADESLVAGLNLLLPQLSGSAGPLDLAALTRILEHDAVTMLLASDGERVLGALTLVLFPLPTGTRAWIEDVVVDDAARGRGVGEALTREALRLAGAAGAATVDLTSRPSRVAANRLYRKAGFAPRETTVYRYAGPPVS